MITSNLRGEETANSESPANVNSHPDGSRHQSMPVEGSRSHLGQFYPRKLPNQGHRVNPAPREFSPSRADTEVVPDTGQDHLRRQGGEDEAGDLAEDVQAAPPQQALDR